MAGMNLKALQQFIAAQQAMEDGLVSFKAGRMDFDPSSRMVTAEKTPGKVKLVRDDGGLVHFNWQSRLSGETKLDVMLLPGSAVWERVKECTDGRVFVLRMIDGGRKHFFWMQEPKEDKDEELAEKVSKLCKGDSSSGSAAGGGLGGLGGFGGAGGATDPYQAQLQRALAESARAAGGGGGGSGATFGGAGPAAGSGAPDINQLMMNALLGRGAGAAGAGGSSGPGTGGGSAMTAGGGAAGSQDALARALAAMLTGGAARAGPTEAEIAAMREQLAKEPRLTDILDPAENAEIAAIIDDDEKVAEALKQHLPSEMQSADDILSQMELSRESPEFRSALKRLEVVLNSPDIQAIMSQLGLKFNQKMGVGAFIAAVIEKHGTAESTGAAASGDGDAEMTDQSS